MGRLLRRLAAKVAERRLRHGHVLLDLVGEAVLGRLERLLVVARGVPDRDVHQVLGAVFVVGDLDVRPHSCHLELLLGRQPRCHVQAALEQVGLLLDQDALVAMRAQPANDSVAQQVVPVRALARDADAALAA